ncbi:hypothetical protein PT282_01430 [Bifidobacterium sp. ESL0763]|uniref:hypothetical protein n=1 Tax=Bifidobacterium sp. ESL0763 TaxID=2983227 RepID=UPI0023F7C948|nr:hypothetical protein [Bifidobacterium sp. ESL0763]MDF7663343.1 hypothetical protein [Bifidobacterium sp. ESL0763]
MNDDEIFERFGITAEEMDESAEAAENGTFEVDPDSIVRFRPITPEVRAAIDRAVAYWDAKDAEKAKRQVVGVHA